MWILPRDTKCFDLVVVATPEIVRPITIFLNYLIDKSLFRSQLHAAAVVDVLARSSSLVGEWLGRLSLMALVV